MTDRMSRRFAAGLRRDPIGIVLLAAVAIIVAMVAAAPLLTDISPIETDFRSVLAPPSFAHPLGTDDFGRDVLARMLYGGGTSLAVAFVAALIVMTIGIAVGITAGYFGGAIDLVATKIIDVLLAFPRLVLAIAVATLMGGGIVPLVVAISIVAWPAYARIVRGFTLQVRDEGYVQAARCMGTPGWKILLHHIALTLIGPILVLGLLDVGNLILAISALSFLGLGVQPPAPEWGAMLNEGRTSMEEAPWLVLAPGFAIFIVVLAVNYFGDLVRDSAEGRPKHGPREWLRWPRRERAPARARDDDDALLDMQGVRVAVADPRSPYDGRVIVDGVDLRIGPGECVGLIGESGSGKSTLATLALGLTKPPLARIGGTLRLFGEDTRDWDWDDWRRVRGRRVTLVNQDPLSALNPILRIGDQLRETLTAHGEKSRDAIERRIRAALADVHLDESAIGRYPHEMSGGMRQRVVIAMATINRPALLIADEPTTALDVSTQARILELLRDLRRKYGLGMLFISHDLRIVANVADRLIILRDGAIVETGDAAAIFKAPQAAYTRELLAAVPGRRRRKAFEHPAGAADARA